MYALYMTRAYVRIYIIAHPKIISSGFNKIFMEILNFYMQTYKRKLKNRP